MIRFILRCAIAALSLGLTVYLFATGFWGWGIVMILITAFIGLSFIRNENMILALNQMRQGNTDKASYYINKITQSLNLFAIFYRKFNIFDHINFYNFITNEQFKRSCIQTEFINSI